MCQKDFLVFFYYRTIVFKETEKKVKRKETFSTTMDIHRLLEQNFQNSLEMFVCVIQGISTIMMNALS